MSPLTKKQLVYKGVCLLVKRQLIHIDVSKLLTELVSKEPIVNIGYVCEYKDLLAKNQLANK